MVALDLRRSIHSIPDTEPAMLAWSRRPTPSPHAGLSVATPSNTLPPSSSIPNPKSLSIFTANVADGLLPSPLPSPRGPSASTSSKTAAFFGSPFAATGPPTPVPPSAPLRNDTLTTPSKPTESISGRSLTADFFAASAFGTRPTPPSSIKSSASSREPSPPRLPPLSRFFPSRYAADPTVEEHDDEDPLYHRRKGTDWETNFKREFLNLSESVAAILPPSPPLTTSPTQTNPLSPPMKVHQLPEPHLLNASTHRAPIRRETHLNGASRGGMVSGFEELIPARIPILAAGTRLESGHAKLTLMRTLGEGAFSNVWLATDDADTLASQSLPHFQGRPDSLRRKSSSWAKKDRDKQMQGIKPPSISARSPHESEAADGSVVLDEQDGEGATAVLENVLQVLQPKGRLVAVKMIDRTLCDADDRTRISFVREVEVLRHIAHPSIVAYLHSFTSSTHHCLVLEHIGGGELFDLVNSDKHFAHVTEPAVRRMWGELCRAVGWMHGIELVHRDIKLENILLTQNIFVTNNPLPPPSMPLIKLTDFGLSRFIVPASPLLSTRCGSESYAAPELVLGASSVRSTATDGEISETSEPKGYYDGRQTDAWACGVVLYTLATRQLPFDTPPPQPVSATPSRAGSVLSTRSNRSVGSGSIRLRSTNRRRDMLMRIAQCEYYWPDEVQLNEDEQNSPIEENEEEELDAQVAAARRLASPGLKRVVRRLLERNPSRRARMVDLWDESWLRGEGAPAPPLCAPSNCSDTLNGNGEPNKGGDDHDDEWRSHDGVLLDGEHIDSIASQELEPFST